tara:strand:+ start:1002 stop:1631 length:630 start_codon:yes stop_codon:yes gene_type:complete
MKKSIGIIDFGINNIKSLQKAFNKVEVKAEVVESYKKLQNFSHIVLPGVGSFDTGIENLKEMGFIEEIHKLVQKGNFILGICLGMQLLFEESKESLNNTPGLSLAKGKCEKLKIINNYEIRVPHIGWNSLKIKKKDVKLLKNIKDNSDFYFVHSYYVVPENSDNITAVCNHGVEFAAVYESNNIFGVQFHPEKCLKNGLNILKQFSQFS